MKQLRKNIEQKKNVKELNIICYEYILLEFKKLIEWIYAPDDEFLIKRRKVILAREKFLDAIEKSEDYKRSEEIKQYCNSLDEYNVEQLSAKMLFELTRNTGFEVTKSCLGECWTKDCCEFTNRQADDICGLDERRLIAHKKMMEIYERTSLATELKKVGLEI